MKTDKKADMKTDVTKNDMGLDGIDFVEFASPQPEKLDALFKHFGFSRLLKHQDLNIDYFRQNDIHFFLNKEPISFADSFAQTHGPAICSMGWRVKNAEQHLKKQWNVALVQQTNVIIQSYRQFTVSVTV